MLSTRINVALSATNKANKSTFILGKWGLARSNNSISFQNKTTRVVDSSPLFDRRANNFPSRNVHFVAPRVPLQTISPRTFASAKFQEKADIFGDLSDQKFERIEIEEEDEGDRKEEEFLKNEAKPPRRSVPSAGKYAKMIKEHIGSGDLKAGLQVLDQVREDRSKPNYYMFNLLIRAVAQRGDLKKCFSLYNRMKKEELKPTPATYVSLLNACAESTSSRIAVEKLGYIRQKLIENNVAMNQAIYNSMIKAYGRHGNLLEAFQLVDEMKDKKLTIGITTLNHLLQGSISDQEAGFRHALVVWHVLKSRKLKPDIYTFNLLLRSARDCRLGDFKVEDLMVLGSSEEAPRPIGFADRTNLLLHPPVVSPLMRLIGDKKKPETEVVEKRHSSELDAEPVAPIVALDASSPQTNLLVMGGFKSFVEQMKLHNVQPDVKTITYLMEIVPPTVASETAVINYAKSMRVKLDVDFYNLLIKKRSFRFDYDNALKVLTLMQQDRLEPNIMTWGVLALTCRTSDQAKEIFEGMALSGHSMNCHIVGAILRQATSRWLFGLVLELMEKMRTEGPKPNDKIFEVLESFRKKAAKIHSSPDQPDWVRKPHWQNGWRKFNLRYDSWMTEMKVNPPSNRKKK